MDRRVELSRFGKRGIVALFVPAALSLGSCGPAAGSRPSDMSAAPHQTMAEKSDREAQGHEARDNPKAISTQPRCTGSENRICWTEMIDPTQEYLEAAQKVRQLAAQNRATSRALRAAEAVACRGIADDDRDISPFAHFKDIRSVVRLREEVPSPTPSAKIVRDEGARVVFHPTPGLTVAALQRVVNCHLARNAAVGHSMPEMPYCPLVPRNIKATVKAVGDGFAVDIHSDDGAALMEIGRRVQMIVPGG